MKHDPLFIRYFRWLMLIGLSSLELWNLPHLTGFASGISLVFVGACGGALVNYRSERGLWMLSALFAVMVGLFLSFACFGIIRDVARTGFFADGLLVHWGWGFFLLQLIYLFVSLLRVISLNRKISRTVSRLVAVTPFDAMTLRKSH